MRTLQTILITAILIAHLSAFAGVTNITSHSCHDTIAGAVAAANNGDTLLVSTGRYDETVSITALGLAIDGKYSADFSAKAGAGATVVAAGGVSAAYGGAVRYCIIAANSAHYGGGVKASPCDIINCLIYGNVANYYGGGCEVMQEGTIQSCTIVANSADLMGGGVRCSGDACITNCIIYSNKSQTGGPNHFESGTGVYYSFCCTFPAVTGSYNGVGNITNDPEFVNLAGGDYHLLDSSPCIDAGTNMPWMTGALDIDGNPRMHDGTVDMGCYEFIPEPALWGALLVVLVARMRPIRPIRPIGPIGLTNPIKFTNNKRRQP